jgi:hypothetical protein
LLPFLDTGALVATLYVYPAPRRTTPSDAPGVDLIVALALQKPCATVDASGVMTLLAGAPGMNQITAEGAWATLVNASGAVVLDCDVSAAGGIGDIWLSAGGAGGLVLYAGGETYLASGVLS